MNNKKITITALAEVITILVTKVDQISTKVDQISTRLGEVEQRLDNLEQRLDNLEQRFGNLEQRFGKLEETVDNLALMTYKEFQKIDRRFESNEEKITHMQRDINELKYGQIEIKGMFKTKTDTKDFEEFKKKCEPLFY